MLAWYQNPKKHLILAQFSNSPWTRYGKQLLEDVKYRKEWAEKVGLGFDLPTSNPGLFGLRGLQNEENHVAA
jgi:hypothetical protein